MIGLSRSLSVADTAVVSTRVTVSHHVKFLVGGFPQITQITANSLCYDPFVSRHLLWDRDWSSKDKTQKLLLLQANQKVCTSYSVFKRFCDFIQKRTHLSKTQFIQKSASRPDSSKKIQHKNCKVELMVFGPFLTSQARSFLISFFIILRAF